MLECLDELGVRCVPFCISRLWQCPLQPATAVGDFVDGSVSSLSMIIVTELGDKTFFIAAIMAMRSSRLPVFVGALLGLAVMTVLSAALGYVVPSLFSPKYTIYMAAALFGYFGVKLLKGAWEMSPGGDEEESEELKEAADELNKKRDVAEPEPLDANGEPTRRKKVEAITLESVIAVLGSPILAQAFSETTECHIPYESLSPQPIHIRKDVP